MKPKVFFSRDISPEKIIELYEMTGRKLEGRVAVKVHSGEPGNQNFLRPDFWRPAIEHVGGHVVECNTGYGGQRDTSEQHRKAIEAHGWNRYFQIDLMDDEGPDMELPIPQGKHIKVDYVGKNLANYDSTLVLAHFKGHPMGGYGGGLKQLAIGFASSKGKKIIHGAGIQLGIVAGKDEPKIDQDSFLESMADAAWAVQNYFGGRAVYINVMKNMSVDCDCCAVAEDPCMKDIGILASLDPIAIDQACIDLIYAADDPGREHFLERLESRHGIHTIEAAAELGFGSREYELVEV